MAESDIKTELDGTPDASAANTVPVVVQKGPIDVPARTPGRFPPTPEALGKLLPGYEVERLLGQGGMGAVFRARQINLHRTVAIKLLSAELAENRAFVARFQREARTLARLQHAGIVAVYDFGQTTEGHLYFVMEYVDGTDLQRLLKEQGLTPNQTYGLMEQICDALRYAHAQGVIHRDIKPANILLNKDGEAKLVDFGLARPLDDDRSSLTLAGACMGTPAYMAPEQRVDAGQADQRADIFALGVMLYEMLTGERPKGSTFAAPSTRFPLNPGIDAIVLKAMQPAPDQRYQDVGELQSEVTRLRTQIVHPVPVAVPVEAPKPVRAGPKGKGTFLLAALVIALSGVAGMAISKMKMAAGAHPESIPAPVEKPVATSATPSVPVAAATPNPSDDPAVFEKILRSYAWKNRGGFELKFVADHVLEFQGPKRTLNAHWWIVGTRKVHFQHASQQAEYDPNIGDTLLFDPTVTSWMNVGNPGGGTREERLPDAPKSP